MALTRKERLTRAISGASLDRVPVGAWGHFYDKECTAHDLARAMIDFTETFDWDFVKVHSRASYHVEGWGFTYEPSNDPAKLHRCTGHPIDSADAWRAMRPLSMETPALKEQIDAYRQIRKHFGDAMPIIMTVFSPLDVAEKLVDRDAALLKAHIEQNPEALSEGLDAITQTFERFVAQLVDEGVDGIYFSTKWVNRVKLDAQQYRALAQAFDMRVLAAAKPLWCNIAHLCEDQITLSAVADYPVHVFHWDSCAHGNPDLAQGYEQIHKAVGGGVDSATLASGSAVNVLERGKESIRAMQGRNMILGPGCSVQIAKTSADNLHALRRASDEAMS